MNGPGFSESSLRECGLRDVSLNPAVKKWSLRQSLGGSGDRFM